MMKAPRSTLPTMDALPNSKAELIWSCVEEALLPAMLVAALAAAAVAIVYTDPRVEVTTPAPDSARVNAAPPSEVMTVYAFPPNAR